MLSFRLFDMEADPTCRYDYLDVYNGHTRLVQKLGRFCGTFRPGAIIATSNTMMLEMVSDEGTGGRGFIAAFSAGKPHVEGEGDKNEKGHCNTICLNTVSQEQKQTPFPYYFKGSSELAFILFFIRIEHQFCGGRLTKAQGSVKTPNWPNSNYPAGISCSWHISVEPSNVSQSYCTTYLLLKTDPMTEGLGVSRKA